MLESVMKFNFLENKKERLIKEKTEFKEYLIILLWANDLHE
jgi:hypothetical protein